MDRRPAGDGGVMRVGSLFSGIGGFDLGLERAGMRVEWQVENNDYCREVLKKHWPNVPCHYDITVIDWRFMQPVDVLCGGPPCQPFSLIGQRRGAADTRNLWPETLSAVGALRPRWVLFENVVGVEQYLAESVLPVLEAAGYTNTPWGEIIPLDLPACAVGAPHIRHRIWIAAHLAGESLGFPGQPRNDERLDELSSADAESLGRQQRDTNTRGGGQRAATQKIRARPADCDRWPSPPDVCRVDVRVPDWSHRIKAIGNSIVPQIAEALGRMMMQVSGESGGASRSA